MERLRVIVCRVQLGNLAGCPNARYGYCPLPLVFQLEQSIRGIDLNIGCICVPEQCRCASWYGQRTLPSLLAALTDQIGECSLYL
ncbi:hypothetical protein D3C75_1145270 [compost metagenome]